MKPLIAIILTTFVVLSACTLNFSPPVAEIRISVSGAARALTADSLSWELSGEGPHGAVLDAVTLASGSNTIEHLIIGTWTLRLIGKDEVGDTVSQGGALVDLQPGPNEVTIAMVNLGLVASSGTAPNGGVLVTSGQVYTDSSKSVAASYDGATLADGVIKSPPTNNYVVEFTAFDDATLSYAWILDGILLTGEAGPTLERVVTSMSYSTIHHLSLVVTDAHGNVYSQEIALDIGSPS